MPPGAETGSPRSAVTDALRPRRGEVWTADLDPVVGRELGRKVRPVLVVSSDEMNLGRFERVMVVPSTSQQHEIPCHVEWQAVRQSDRTRMTSYFCCEDLRSVSVLRLQRRILPSVAPGVLATVEDWLKTLLGL
jgi:mRNA-degrading endonuclease toxin of MazEF toxin-antitoxin module